MDWLWVVPVGIVLVALLFVGTILFVITRNVRRAVSGVRPGGSYRVSRGGSDGSSPTDWSTWTPDQSGSNDSPHHNHHSSSGCGSSSSSCSSSSSSCGSSSSCSSSSSSSCGSSSS